MMMLYACSRERAASQNGYAKAATTTSKEHDERSDVVEEEEPTSDQESTMPYQMGEETFRCSMGKSLITPQ